MLIRGVRDRGLRQLIEDDDDRRIRRDLVPRVRNVLTALVSAPSIDDVKGPPGWRMH
jgi:proteic killer suppression protein